MDLHSNRIFTVNLRGFAIIQLIFPAWETLKFGLGMFMFKDHYLEGIYGYFQRARTAGRTVRDWLWKVAFIFMENRN